MVRDVTLLELVRLLFDRFGSEEEVVSRAIELVEKGEAVLIGNFAGHRLGDTVPAASLRP